MCSDNSRDCVTIIIVVLVVVVVNSSTGAGETIPRGQGGQADRSVPSVSPCLPVLGLISFPPGVCSEYKQESRGSEQDSREGDGCGVVVVVVGDVELRGGRGRGCVLLLVLSIGCLGLAGIYDNDRTQIISQSVSRPRQSGDTPHTKIICVFTTPQIPS